MKRFRYFVLLAILMIPVTLIDGAIGHMTPMSWQFIIRLLFLLLAIQVARFIAPPS
ncbi:MAG: hypothetical protein Q7S96_01935 [bacterium]|nr:hypothetical protein [bacterium]